MVAWTAGIAPDPASAQSRTLDPEEIAEIRSVSAAALSRDGERVAFTVVVPRGEDEPRGPDRSHLYVVPAEGGPVRRLTESPAGVGAYALSPDRARVAYTAREPLPREVVERRERGWNMTVYGEDVRHVRLWTEQKGGGDRTPVTPDGLTVREFAWHPSGDALAVQVTDDPGADPGQHR